MAVITTLGFSGRTEEALAFYRNVIGADTLFLMRFRDCPDQSHAPPGHDDLIFHATFRIHGTEFMASDVGFDDTDSNHAFAGFSLLLRYSEVGPARLAFDALADGGQIVVPLAVSRFTSWYGVVVDRFGVSWKVNVDQEGG